MREAVAITGVGMVTAVGLTAEHTCAAVRCGIARFAETKGVVDRFGEPVISASPPLGERGEDPAVRCSSMSASAFRQALRELAADRMKQRPTDIFLLSSDTATPPGERGTEEAFRAVLDGTGKISVAHLPFGNAAGMVALQEACDRIADDPRRLEIISGYDNLTCMEALRRLETAHRLKSSSRPRGVIPGEAAACVCLESASFVRAEGRQAYAAVKAASTAREDVPIGNPNPCLGAGLTTAVRDCLKDAGWDGETVGRVYCDLNGEEYRAHEWMLTLSRIAVKSRPTHPADCIGDVGASFSPLLIGSAAIALRRGYANTDKILVFCSSESGMRGAACLSPLPEGRGA
jgi:3-oxoacyl-[acyl-carrier-protein] synthase-1